MYEKLKSLSEGDSFTVEEVRVLDESDDAGVFEGSYEVTKFVPPTGTGTKTLPDILKDKISLALGSGSFELDLVKDGEEFVLYSEIEKEGEKQTFIRSREREGNHGAIVEKVSL